MRVGEAFGDLLGGIVGFVLFLLLVLWLGSPIGMLIVLAWYAFMLIIWLLAVVGGDYSE